jgi:hypothetical protein
MARRERMVAKDALFSPLGVAVKMRLNSPANKTEAARQKNTRLCRVMSLLPGNAESTARYPGMRNTRIRARSDRVPCRDEDERWTSAKAITEIKTDATRYQGGGQASLIFFVLLYSSPKAHAPLLIKPFSHEKGSLGT